MSTTMPKAQNITRKWYVIDAADKPPSSSKTRISRRRLYAELKLLYTNVKRLERGSSCR